MLTIFYSIDTSFSLENSIKFAFDETFLIEQSFLKVTLLNARPSIQV